MNKQFLFLVLILFSITYGQQKEDKLSIEEAIKIGLKNNLNIKNGKESINKIRGKFWSAISLPQPQIGINYEYIPVNQSLNHYNEKSVMISQSFEFPINYFLKGEKMIFEEETEYLKLIQAERTVIKEVKIKFYKVLLNQYQIKYAYENLEITKDFLKKAEIRQEVGEGTYLEKLTARVQFTEAENNLQIVKNELIKAFSDLNFAMGLKLQTVNSSYNLLDSLVFTNYNISFEEICNKTSQNNLFIKIAEQNYKTSIIENKLAWISLLPNINLSYFKQFRDGNSGFYGASFGISLPLWFMFEQRGKIQETAASQSISESELELTKSEIILHLRNAFIDYENNLKQVILYLNDILPQAEEIYRTAAKSYDIGELPYIEYLQAKQTLLDSRNNYLQILYNHYLTIFRIEEISGESIIIKSKLEK
jgi:cobalt-zinc-cadmium efflux system outer membrane protein